MLRTLMAGMFLAVYLLLLGPPLILLCLLFNLPGWIYRVGLTGARGALVLAGIRVVAEGLENVPAGACIFVGNHASNADPLAVASVIPRRLALLGKKEVFRIPILGRALRLANMVPVDRADAEAAKESVEEALEHLKRGVSFLIFPEGTRSLDGRLRPFKKGSFVMAIRAQVPIVPVSVVGAQKIMRKGEFGIQPGIIRVKFHPPTDASAYSLDQRDELLERVYAAVASGLPEAQQPQQ